MPKNTGCTGKKGRNAVKAKDAPGPKASCLAILGTGSDVGKSVVVTALCRCLVRRGVRVAPFKAQNMSNNSGVTPEGLEMGRAQIVQAEASKIVPHVDMNPVLLKPTSEVGSQVVVLGKAVENSTARDYHLKKETLFHTAAKALDRLRKHYEAIVMEGAGSCAEVNLMENDITNMRMAAHADAPVVLVADIHRGGVFAQIVGSLECLPPVFRDRIKGFIINRFRGDGRLFETGVRWLEEKTGRPVFGVLPWFQHIRIEPEDSVVIERPRREPPPKMEIPSVAVIRLPHISNFNDFDPLAAVKGLEVYFLKRPRDLSPFKAVILPGSKSTRYDLTWLHETGWAERIRAHARNGGYVLGICGGYQMMGHWVHDSPGLEGPPGKTEGLHLLPVETVLKAPKVTTLTRFCWQEASGGGYEIHMGQTVRRGGSPLFRVVQRNRVPLKDTDGCIGQGGNCMGTYIHGLFDNPEIVRLWLAHIGVSGVSVDAPEGHRARDREYDKLAAFFEAHVDVDGILALKP